MIRPRLTVVKLSIEGDIKMFANRPLCSSILLALFVNAIEAFGSVKSSNPAIDIKIENGTIRFTDNGGGFPSETMSLLKSGQPTSGKEAGTGLRLFLVRSGMSEMGGRAKFYNSGSHAVIEMKFSKKIWLAVNASEPADLQLGA